MINAVFKADSGQGRFAQEPELTVHILERANIKCRSKIDRAIAILTVQDADRHLAISRDIAAINCLTSRVNVTGLFWAKGTCGAGCPAPLAAIRFSYAIIVAALLDAGIMRLRPVLITVGATVIALFPLAVHGGPLWEPLCYAQIGGLAIATFITLLLVPVLYSIFVLDLRIVKWK